MGLRETKPCVMGSNDPEQGLVVSPCEQKIIIHKRREYLDSQSEYQLVLISVGYLLMQPHAYPLIAVFPMR
jgi:hypothetical protein